eukprot:6367970-Amphidinium_carterae.1
MNTHPLLSLGKVVGKVALLPKPASPPVQTRNNSKLNTTKIYTSTKLFPPPSKQVPIPVAWLKCATHQNETHGNNFSAVSSLGAQNHLRAVMSGTDTATAVAENNELPSECHLLWIALPRFRRNRKDDNSKHEHEPRFWSLNPAELQHVARLWVNDNLSKCGIAPWSVVWDVASKMSSLRRLQLSTAEVEDAALVAQHANVEDTVAGTFWGKSRVGNAMGQLVGLALIAKPQLQRGVLSWHTREHKSCSLEQLQRLCFFRVLDVVAISDFALTERQIAFMKAAGTPLTHSDAVQLMPVSAESGVHGGASNVRTPLFSGAAACVQTWKDLPCTRVSGGRVFEAAGTVQEVIAKWQQAWTLPTLEKDTGILRLWPPLAVSILQQRWHVLGYVPPFMNAWSRRRQGGVWFVYFDGVDKTLVSKVAAKGRQQREIDVQTEVAS